MPGRDRTGPMGRDPATGGGFGRCTATPEPGLLRCGRGAERGGFGRGRRNRFWATGRFGWQRAGGREEPMLPRVAAAERKDLQREVDALEAELQRLRTRIETLEAPSS